MKLKGIRATALLLAAVILVISPVAGMAGGRGSDAPRYWWEEGDLTPHEREQAREIMVLIFDHYFAIDVSAMSPEEFEEVGLSIGTEKILRLFTQYAEKRGFEIPGGIPDPRSLPVGEEYVHPVHLTLADVRYWWELVGPECREATIAAVREMFPQVVDVMDMTPEEINLLLDPPPPPLRLLSLEERKEKRPTVDIAIYGRPRTYESQVEIREWLDRLRGVQEKLQPWAFSLESKLEGVRAGKLLHPIHGLVINSLGVCSTGYLRVGLNLDKLTREEALAFAAEIYPLIAESARAVGIQDVPVVFSLTKLRTLAGEASSPRHERHRPIRGGIQMSRRRIGTEPAHPSATIGFALRCPTTHERGYTVTGHLGYGGARAPINMQIYQPTVTWWWPWPNRAGTVADVASRFGRADVARVAFANVSPWILTWSGGRTSHAVWGTADAPTGTTVHMAGQASCLTTGTILKTGLTVASEAFGVLFNQSVGDFHATWGDSGAPVFRLINSRLKIVGVQWGVEKDEAGNHVSTVFSPICGVLHELEPFVVYTIHCP
ncbi:S1 family peptidase [Dehalococcoidia bacterium]|nr:S1 family peptidase [Dehalococcoidia bacterium]